MFGRRADGRRCKDVLGIEKATGYFMPQRIDAVNLFRQEIIARHLDDFIKKEKEESGVHFTYTEILLAACVRLLATRKKLNRFVINSQIYDRNEITISMNVKPRLVDECDEICCKFHFTGRESIYEVKEIVEKELEHSLASGNMDVDQGTNKTVKFLSKLPYWAYAFAVGLFRFMDKYGLLPKSLIDISPFHTSMYVTDLRSIKLDKIYHHLYNFGTTTIFASLGRVKYRAVSDRDGNTSVEKIMELGLTLDERVCDGLYYGNSLRKFMEYIHNPSLLKERLPEPELTEKEKKKAMKKAKKESKIAQKLEKKKKKTVTA